jgi:hypothetical protein
MEKVSLLSDSLRLQFVEFQKEVTFKFLNLDKEILFCNVQVEIFKRIANKDKLQFSLVPFFFFICLYIKL